MDTTVGDRLGGLECPTALDGETVVCYIGGRLGESEAEAFEEHFFSCEDCWALVQVAREARASFEREPEVVRAADRPTPRPRAARWTVLAPAAGLAAAIAGLALFSVRRSEPPQPSGEVFRGVVQVMALEAALDGQTLTASWTPVPGAADYELRVYDRDGRLLLAADAEGGTLTVDVGAAGNGGGQNVASADVVAMDEFGQVLRRSGRVPLLR